MNITCVQCHKRYSIADDKVRGKSVKIRCKHCKSLMSIKGPALEDVMEEERTVAMSAGEVARLKDAARSVETTTAETVGHSRLDPSVVWFAMVKGKQQGPLDVKALRAKVKQKEVLPRTYVWHHGMGDWKRARDVPEIAGLFSSGASAPNAKDDPAQTQPDEDSVAGLTPSAGEGTSNREPVKDRPNAPKVIEGALSSLQIPAPGVAKAKGDDVVSQDPLGELFSDAELPKVGRSAGDPGVDDAGAVDGPLFSPEPLDARGAASRRSAKEVDAADPFDSLGEADPKMLPAPGEATRFFIEKAGVNRRNPPWKIALFLAAGIFLPVSVLYALSTMKIVPLEVTRVDDQGNEVRESLFTANGVSGIADLLSGKAKAKKESALAAREGVRPTAGARKLPEGAPLANQPGRETKMPRPNAPTPAELAALYGDTQKIDRGPRVRQDTEERAKDTTTGGLSPESVAKVVAQTQPAFQQCIEQELRKNPGFRGGKIDIVATVGSSGTVKRTEIDKRDIDLSDLGGCLKGRAKRMQFPTFSGEEETEVHIPLILSATL